MEPLTVGAGAYLLGSTLYNMYQNYTTREREDNAVQRRVSDLQRAGLSPTLAAGSAAASTATPQMTGENPFQKMMEMKQAYQNLDIGRANINHTNAQTELAQMQATSELFHQGVMQSQKAGMDLENAWIDAMKLSQLGLNKAETDKLEKQLGEITANTSLLKAKTAFEQTYTDYYKTLNENARINQDILINNRSWNDFINQSKIFSNYASSSAPGLFAGAIGTLASKVDRQFPRFGLQQQGNWYYPPKK